MTNTEKRISHTTWTSVAVVICMFGGLALWMYDGERELNQLHDQQVKHWASIEQLFRERTKGLLEIRAIIKKEAPYETAIISELAYAQVMMEGARNRNMQIEAYNESELTRVSLPVFMYNIERLNAHPRLGGMVESLSVLATRIDKERFDYNLGVRAYNARLLIFPTNLTALLLRIEPLPLFRLRGE